MVSERNETSGIETLQQPFEGLTGEVGKMTSSFEEIRSMNADIKQSMWRIERMLAKMLAEKKLETGCSFQEGGSLPPLTPDPTKISTVSVMRPATELVPRNNDLKNTISDLRKDVHLHYGSWFSELSILKNEVRDRSILVRVCSEQWMSELTVHGEFSKVGRIEQFNYMSIESGFHYRICFRDANAASYAFNFYNGRYVYESCRFEVSLVNEVITSYVKKASKIVEVSKQTAELVLDEGAEKFQVLSKLSLDEEVAQIKVEDKPIVAVESTEPTAYQVFDEVSMLFDEAIELSEALPKESEMSIDAPLLSWSELEGELRDGEIDGSSSDEDKLDGHVRDLCFDPGGDYLMVTSYGLLEERTKLGVDNQNGTRAFASSLIHQENKDGELDNLKALGEDNRCVKLLLAHSIENQGSGSISYGESRDGLAKLGSKLTEAVLRIFESHPSFRSSPTSVAEYVKAWVKVDILDDRGLFRTLQRGIYGTTHTTATEENSAGPSDFQNVGKVTKDGVLRSTYVHSAYLRVLMSMLEKMMSRCGCATLRVVVGNIMWAYYTLSAYTSRQGIGRAADIENVTENVAKLGKLQLPLALIFYVKGHFMGLDKRSYPRFVALIFDPGGAHMIFYDSVPFGYLSLFDDVKKLENHQGMVEYTELLAFDPGGSLLVSKAPWSSMTIADFIALYSMAPMKGDGQHVLAQCPGELLIYGSTGVATNVYVEQLHFGHKGEWVILASMFSKWKGSSHELESDFAERREWHGPHLQPSVKTDLFEVIFDPGGGKGFMLGDLIFDPGGKWGGAKVLKSKLTKPAEIANLKGDSSYITGFTAYVDGPCTAELLPHASTTAIFLLILEDKDPSRREYCDRVVKREQPQLPPMPICDEKEMLMRLATKLGDCRVPNQFRIKIFDPGGGRGELVIEKSSMAWVLTAVFATANVNCSLVLQALDLFWTCVLQWMKFIICITGVRLCLIIEDNDPLKKGVL